MLVRNEDTLLHPLWHFRGTRIMKRGTCIIYDVHLQQPTNLGKANLDSIVLSLFFFNGQKPFIHLLFNGLVSVCRHEALTIFHKLVIFLIL